LIVDAALQLVLERGFESASMSMIARRAEISKAVLYDCFPGGKRDLLLGVIERSERALLDAIAARQGAPLEAVIDDPQALRLLFAVAEPLDGLLAARLKLARRTVDDAMGLPSADGLQSRVLRASARELARWLAEDPRRDASEAERIWRTIMSALGARRKTSVA
jgi:AcrR family transcriptional regulator